MRCTLCQRHPERSESSLGRPEKTIRGGKKYGLECREEQFATKRAGAAREGRSNIGIPKSVGRDFTRAAPGGKLPSRAKRKSTRSKRRSYRA